MRIHRTDWRRRTYRRCRRSTGLRRGRNSEWAREDEKESRRGVQRLRAARSGGFGAQHSSPPGPFPTPGGTGSEQALTRSDPHGPAAPPKIRAAQPRAATHEYAIEDDCNQRVRWAVRFFPTCTMPRERVRSKRIHEIGGGCRRIAPIARLPPNGPQFDAEGLRS